jgi:hypothetical protein
MSGVFQNIDPPSPYRPVSVYPPPLVRGEDTLAGCIGGWGVNILEDARHSSVLYICAYTHHCTRKYAAFVVCCCWNKE